MYDILYESKGFGLQNQKSEYVIKFKQRLF